MRFVFWFVVIPFLVIAGAFAAVNHQPLALRLWPLPYELVVPVYAAVLGAFLLGLLVASLWFWVTGLGNRLARRRLTRHERALEEETARLRRELASAPRAPSAPPDAVLGDGNRPDPAPARRLIAGQRD